MYPKRDNEKKQMREKRFVEKRKGIHKIYISKFYNNTIFLIAYKNNALWARSWYCVNYLVFSFFFLKHVPMATLEIAVDSSVNVRLLRPVTTWLVIVFHPRVQLDSRDLRVNIVRTLYRNNTKLCLHWNNLVNIWILIYFLRQKKITYFDFGLWFTQWSKNIRKKYVAN